MLLSTLEVVSCFYKVLHPGYRPGLEDAARVRRQAENLVRRSWTVTNITNRIVQTHKDGPEQGEKAQSLQDIEMLHGTPPLMREGNLLEDKFYYHNRLQRTSGPVTVTVAEDGSITKSREPFYLEMVELFTVDDLTDYFHHRMQLEDENMYMRNRGGFRKMVKSYGPDLLLFTIDTAYRHLTATSKALLQSYNQLFDHIPQGRKLLNNARAASSEKIYPYYRAYLREIGSERHA